MSRADKTLAAMRRNPRDDWRIEELKSIAARFGIPYRQPGTSHVTFAPKGARPLTVPAHKPIKAIYVRLFVDMIEGLRHGEENED